MRGICIAGQSLAAQKVVTIYWTMETSTPSHPPDSKVHDVPPMPDHWDIARGVPFPGAVKLLIYIAGGRTTMEEIWAGTYPGSPVYPEWKSEMRERMAHINVVVSIELYQHRRNRFESRTGRVAPRNNLGVLYDRSSRIDVIPVHAFSYVCAILFIPRGGVCGPHRRFLRRVCDREEYLRFLLQRASIVIVFAFTCMTLLNSDTGVHAH